jgi:hypothetical protein
MNDFTDSDRISVVRPAIEAYSRRTITVDFLYLDDQTCERCLGTGAALETALDRVEPILDAMDVGIALRDVHVSTLAAAEATRLAVSPTVRIDGRDVQPDYVENACESCGDLCGCVGDVTCRLWRYRGEEHATAPVDLLVEALVRAVAATGARFDRPAENDAGGLSSNVREFFEGARDSDSERGCGC